MVANIRCIHFNFLHVDQKQTSVRRVSVNPISIIIFFQLIYLLFRSFLVHTWNIIKMLYIYFPRKRRGPQKEEMPHDVTSASVLVFRFVFRFWCCCIFTSKYGMFFNVYICLF